MFILKYRPALLAAPCHALLTSHILIGQISTSGLRETNYLSCLEHTVKAVSYVVCLGYADRCK